MALPLARRPPAVVHFIEEEKRSSLKLKIDKKEIFMKSMITWYEKLSKKEKGNLTKKKLIRKAISEAFRLSLPQNLVPPDWIDIMKKECNLVCYISKNALERREKRKREAAEKEFRDELGLNAVTKIPKLENEYVKKFIDLTSEPPPREWTLDKLAGKPVKRYMAIYSDDHSTILYWDYDTSHWKLEKRSKSL